jgi:Rho GDP-dissociation inhibitor
MIGKLFTIINFWFFFVFFLSGSRAPSGEIQTYVSEPEQTPSGVLSRGSFLVKSKLTDDDKNIYAEWEWNLVISKDWQ